MIFAAAHKMLFFLASSNLKASLTTPEFNEEAYNCLYLADAHQYGSLLRCVDCKVKSSPIAMGDPLGRLSKMLHRCGDRVPRGRPNHILVLDFLQIRPLSVSSEVLADDRSF